jgi:hypothetical protein
MQKGGKLITIDAVKKTFETSSVFPDGSSFTYKKFWRIAE